MTEQNQNISALVSICLFKSKAERSIHETYLCLFIESVEASDLRKNEPEGLWIPPTLLVLFIFILCDAAKRISFVRSSFGLLFNGTRYFAVEKLFGCVQSKAPERRFNGCLHQIRKTITKIHIKFIVAPFSRLSHDCNIFSLFCLFTLGILMFVLEMDFSDEMFSSLAIFPCHSVFVFSAMKIVLSNVSANFASSLIWRLKYSF